MNNIWNPYAFGVTGEPMAPQTQALRVYGAEPTEEQLAMAQQTFAKFCMAARLSAVPNPMEQGFLPDGSKYRIVTVGNTRIMELRVEAGEGDEPILWGILLDFAGSADQILLTPGGTLAAPNGAWAVTKVKGWMVGMSVWPELVGNRLPGWANNSWVSADAKKWLIQDWYQNYFARGGKIVAVVGASTPAIGVLGFTAAKKVGDFYEYTGLTFDGDGKIFSQSANIGVDLFANPPPITQYVGLSGSDEILDVADLPATHFYFSNYCLNRHGTDVLVVTRKEGDALLPYNGGSPDEANAVYLNYRNDHQLKFTNTYPPRLAWVSPTLTPLYSVERATQEVWLASASGGRTKIYGAPTATATPPSERIAYQAAPSGGVAAAPTYADVSFTGSIPQIDTVRDDPNNFLREGGGPVSYSEEFTCEFTDVYGAWFNADNSICIIPQTTKEEYHVTQSGAYEYRFYKKVWSTYSPPVMHVSFDFLEDESSNMDVTRELDRSIMLPMPGGAKKLILAKHRFSETAVASHNITGEYDSTYGDLYNLNDTTTSAYSVEVEARELLLVDPFLDLLVYIECAYSYNRSTSTSSSYHYTIFGTDAGIREEFPETWNRSYGGALPPLPTVKLVMICKGVTTTTTLSWGDDYEKENVRRSMAAAVAIPIDEPELSFGNTTSTPRTQNLMEAVWTLENCTRMFKAFPTPAREAGRTRTDSRASMTRGINVRGKLVTPSMNALVQYQFAKDPLTGAAALVLSAVDGRGLGDQVLAYAIDKTGARPLSAIIPGVDTSTITRAIPA